MLFSGSKGRQRSHGFLTIFFLLFGVLASHAATEPVDKFIAFESPGEGFTASQKKPLIRFRSAIPINSQNLLILLDDVDITGGLDFSYQTFEYRPVQSLANGEHHLSLTLTLEDDREIVQEFSFFVEYQGYFDSASSDNQLSAFYERSLKKSAELSSIPTHNLASNLADNSLVSKGNWSVGLRTNLRYLDRSTPIFTPEKKGIDVVDFVLSGRYAEENLNIVMEFGDLQLQETQYTVAGLARKGARAAVDYKGLSLSSFVVQSQQQFGFDGSSNFDFNEADSIRGLAAGVKLFSDRLTLRSLYMTAGEIGSSFGYYTAAGNRKGEVVGFALQGQWFEGKLNLDAEYDLSDFDADTSDEFSANSDRAWALKVNGFAGRYNYQAGYEYVGPNYEVIGNQGLQRDKQGVTLAAGVQGESHALNFSGSRYQDNVEENPLFAQTNMTTAQADYSFSKFQSFPMGLSLQRSIIDSTNEPEFSFPTEIYTDMIAARIGHPRGAWNYSLNASYSKQDDRTSMDYDTRAISFNFAPAYYIEQLAVSPNFSFNRTTDETSKVDTDTETFSLDLRGNLFTGKLLYELAGSYNRMKTDNGTMEMTSLNTNYRVAYILAEKYVTFLNPSIGIRGLYNKTDDKIYHSSTEEFAFLLVLSTNMGLSF